MDTSHVQSGEWSDPKVSLQMLLWPVIAFDQRCHPGHDLDRNRGLSLVAGSGTVTPQNVVDRGATDRDRALPHRLTHRRFVDDVIRSRRADGQGQTRLVTLVLELESETRVDDVLNR